MDVLPRVLLVVPGTPLRLCELLVPAGFFPASWACVFLLLDDHIIERNIDTFRTTFIEHGILLDFGLLFHTQPTGATIARLTSSGETTAASR